MLNAAMLSVLAPKTHLFLNLIDNFEFEQM